MLASVSLARSQDGSLARWCQLARWLARWMVALASWIGQLDSLCSPDPRCSGGVGGGGSCRIAPLVVVPGACRIAPLLVVPAAEDRRNADARLPFAPAQAHFGSRRCAAAAAGSSQGRVGQHQGPGPAGARTPHRCCQAPPRRARPCPGGRTAVQRGAQRLVEGGRRATRSTVGESRARRFSDPTLVSWHSCLVKIFRHMAQSGSGPRTPSLSGAILAHIAADWTEFAEIRAAARALSQKSRLTNALSIAVNEVRVALAAALLSSGRSGSRATASSRDD